MYFVRINPCREIKLVFTYTLNNYNYVLCEKCRLLCESGFFIIVRKTTDNVILLLRELISHKNV